MDLTNQGKARGQGKYHILWYKARALDQTSRTLRLCRYWPEIHRMRSDGFLGTMLEIGPARVKAALRRDPTLAWYELQLNLLKARLVGPFNFESVATTKGREESHRIPTAVWTALEAVGQDHNIPILNLDSKPSTRGRRPQQGATIATVTAEQNDRSNKDESTEQTNKRMNAAPIIRADNKK
eukprot:scaffold1607_cov63-Attheya_sp.AAC.1